MGVVPDSLRFLTDPDIVQLGSDLDSVVTSAKRSFELIEPWFKARSSYDDDTFVNSVVNTVATQAGAYHDAISESIHVARDGFRFAEDAMNIYTRITEGTDTVAHIAIFLSDMLELANQGHKRSLAVSEEFRTIRSELLQVSKIIPGHVFNVMGQCSNIAPGSNITPTPFIDYVESVSLQNNDGVETRILTANVTSQSYPQVVDQLIRISQDIEQLVHCVGAFVNWWSGMATKLFCLQRVIPQIKPDGSNPIRTRDVRRRWLAIRDQYGSYQTRIAEIQDQYQHLSVSSSTQKTSEDKDGSLSETYPGIPPHDIDLEKLAKSARQSFAILDLWRNEKSFDHELVEDMVSRMTRQGPAYYLAINKSAWTAQQGCLFASDAIAFCDRLILRKDALEALQRGLKDVMQIAREAHAGSIAMVVQFRDVRMELFKITKDLISRPLTISDQQGQCEPNVHSREPDWPEKSCNEPVLEVIKAPLSQFELATADLAELIQHVNGFVDWWAEVNTTLANLEMVLPQIKVDGSNPFRTDTVKERWIQVYQNYVSYQRQISETEDYYKDISGEGLERLTIRSTPTASSSSLSLVGSDQRVRRRDRWLPRSFRTERVVHQRRGSAMSQETIVNSISDTRSEVKMVDDVEYCPEPERATIEMAQHIQEVMAISLDLQTAISDQFPSKIARGLIEGVLRIRSMLSISWKKYGTFFRLCQKYSGRYISLCRKAAGSQIGSDSPSTIALIKTAGTARKQVLQMRADHRRITAEFDAHAKKMPTELRRNETSNRARGSINGNKHLKGAQALQGVITALKEISRNLRDLDTFWRLHITQLEAIVADNCSDLPSSIDMDIWVRFERVLPMVIASVDDAEEDDASGPPPFMNNGGARQESFFSAIVAKLNPEISGAAYGTAF